METKKGEELGELYSIPGGMTLSGMSDFALWGEIHCPMAQLRAMVQENDGSRFRRMAEGKRKEDDERR